MSHTPVLLKQTVQKSVYFQSPPTTVEELERQLKEQTEREIETERQHSQHEIYESLRAARAKIVWEAEMDKDTEEQQWEEQGL